MKMRNVNRKRCIEKYSSEEDEEDNDADVEDLSSSDLGDHQQQVTIRNEQINTVDDDFDDDGSDDGETQMPHQHKLSRRRYSLTGKIEAKTGNTSTSIIRLHQKKKEIQAMKTARNQTEGSYQRKLSKGKWQVIHLHM